MRGSIVLVWFVLASSASGQDRGEMPTGKLALSVVDSSGAPLPSRVHLADPAGKPIRPPGLPFWNDHFVCRGGVALDLPPGPYKYTVERGPEHSTASGTVVVEAGKTISERIRLARLVDLRSSGWFSGDLHVHRLPEEMPLLLEAEDLDYGGVVTWWNKANLWADRPVPDVLRPETPSGSAFDLMVGEDEREGGALLYFGLDRPLDLSGAKSREVPPPLQYVAEALRLNRSIHLDAEKPFWWDFPTWAIFGQLGSVGIAHNHMQRSGVLDNEAWGYPRDVDRLPGPGGNGRWTLEIYDRLLETGIRLPPSAGSASGVLPNPVGYNRVYVELPGLDRLDPTLWWEGLRAGRSFVTNGPLLICRAEGEPPGKVFRAKEGTRLPIQLVITVWSRDPIRSIEVIRNGQVASELGAGPQRGVPGPVERRVTLTFDRPGWFLVRAFADVPGTFRFASTAPYYVEIGDEPRISAKSCRFFLHWLEERIDRIETTITDPADRKAVLGFHEQALRAWEERLGLATVE